MWIFEKALKVVLESACWLGSERIDITDASNSLRLLKQYLRDTFPKKQLK